MLKWILILCALIMLGVLGTCFWGYKQITGGGPTAAVTVAMTPERAWTWLSTRDSLQVIADTGKTVTVSGNGMLEMGDSLTVRSSTPISTGAGADIIWVVSSVDAPRVRTFTTREDASKPGSLERIDSVAQVGDSVRISRTFLIGSLSGTAGDSVGKIGGAMLGSAAKVMVGAMRHMAQDDLNRLKDRFERP